MRKLDLLAELTDVMSDGVSQDLWILSVSIDNITTTDHKEGEQLEDHRNVGENSCNFGDGTDQRVQSLMFMMMMMITYLFISTIVKFCMWVDYLNIPKKRAQNIVCKSEIAKEKKKLVGLKF